ncbi:MAG: carbon-nitrogen hydrolase [Candidatus Aminicenantes bacterium]|nr:carbon-nitrogen hydrolase [Candidatus Aminicenantes bacterium]
MKIALAQISPVLGDPGRNLKLHLNLVRKALARKADLLVFPELSLTGYNLKDLAAEVALEPARSPLFQKLLKASREIDLVVGFVEESKREPGLVYNAAAYLAGGSIKHIHRKVFLPTSGMFEEGRFFAAGREFRPFETRFARTGLLVCRDFLHYGASYCYLAGGAGLVITISAAPGRGIAESRTESFETSRMWELMGEAISFFSSALVIYCNRAGYEDGVAFAGGSFVYSPYGKLLARLPYLEEDFTLVEVDLSEIRKARTSWPFRRDERPEVIWRSLEKIIREGHED